MADTKPGYAVKGSPCIASILDLGYVVGYVSEANSDGTALEMIQAGTGTVYHYWGYLAVGYRGQVDVDAMCRAALYESSRFESYGDAIEFVSRFKTLGGAT